MKRADVCFIKRQSLCKVSSRFLILAQPVVRAPSVTVRKGATGLDVNCLGRFPNSFIDFLGIQAILSLNEVGHALGVDAQSLWRTASKGEEIERQTEVKEPH